MMKRSVFIIAIASMVLGLAIIGLYCALGDAFGTVSYHEARHDTDEPFDSVSIATADASIIIKQSENGECYAVCYESEKITYTLSVENRTLTLQENDSRKWYDRIQIYCGSRRVVLYLPEGKYDALDIRTRSGEAEYAEGGLDFGEISCATSSGGLIISNSTANTLMLSSDSGEITLDNVMVISDMQITTSSGDIKLNNCDSVNMVIESHSGEVNATLLSGKQFDVQSDSGRIDCPPHSDGGGKCVVRTASGDIKLSVAE